MANSMFSSSAKPHFLKPILPGFKTNILIPKAFYSKYLEGRQEGNAAELRSDASEITWNINIDGRRMTKGWEEFAVGHNLQVGDILVFRHEGNLLFHVTTFGLSCCEILYSQNDEKDVKDKTGKVTRYRTVKKTVKNECSSVDTDFVVPVTASNQRLDSFYLPRGFTTSSGLSKLCNEIILMDEKGRPSTLKLCYHKSSNRFCVSQGWRAFCCRNGFKTGCFLRPILVRKVKTPVLRIFPFERDENSIRNHSKKIKQEVEHETVKEETNVESGKLIRDRFVVPVTASNQRHDAFHLPKGFTTSSGLSKLCNKIVFMDEKGRSSILDLSYDKSDNRFTVRRGWRAFCCRNGHKTGCFLRLIVVRNEKTPVLRIFPLEKDESSIEKNSKKIKQEVEHESAKEEKNMESLSLSNNSSFVVSVTVSNLREDILYLPIRLSRSNILDKKFHQISLMNKQGRTWTLSLKYSKSSGKFRITHGWKSFCEANDQNAGCTFLFKLVRNRTAPVLLMTSLGDDIHQSKTASFNNSVGPRRSSMGQEVKIMG
ncbi:DNA-binding pseudobarrel domain superfamily [Arabidopsis suecica]|uniref:DNA-binding pseudobarrel domain superfamily n=1 Tax=Arabidopsis suecica TaxID=45249 RepID=A0A8T1YPT9_ARASU|nr:DNA-binding pseudobarrel domain superfamily [Arabidopsis suecica]